MKKPFLFLLLVIASAVCFAGNTNDSITKAPSLASNEIRIMTYNIKMLPRGAVFIHHHPVIRARLIPAKVEAENPDVIVFQEAFDGKAVRTLRKKLKAVYPYTAGFDNRRVVTYNRAGGVLMFSKYPLKEIESIKYTECKGIDCAGNKGAILVEVQHPVKTFQLLGTHMQAGGSKDLKISQYQEASDLLKRHQQQGMPQFVAGDFNTHKDDTALYPKLVSILNAQDGTIDDEPQVIDNHASNDMRGKPDGKKKKKGVIDYVFVKDNGVKIISTERYAREFKQTWSSTHQDLSDHYAVILRVRL